MIIKDSGWAWFSLSTTIQSRAGPSQKEKKKNEEEKELGSERDLSMSNRFLHSCQPSAFPYWKPTPRTRSQSSFYFVVVYLCVCLILVVLRINCRALHMLLDKYSPLSYICSPFKKCTFETDSANCLHCPWIDFVVKASLQPVAFLIQSQQYLWLLAYGMGKEGERNWKKLGEGKL